MTKSLYLNTFQFKSTSDNEIALWWIWHKFSYIFFSSHDDTWFLWKRLVWSLCYFGFHLQLLAFPFMCQFKSTIVALVWESFANDYLLQKDLNIIFKKSFVVVNKWTRIFLHLPIVLYWNEIDVYHFNCHLSYR